MGLDTYLHSEDSSIAAKDSYEAVSPDEGALHLIFAATSDDWMFPEEEGDEYEEGEPPQTQEYEPTENEHEPPQSQGHTDSNCRWTSEGTALSFKLA